VHKYQWIRKGEQPYCRNCLLEKLSKTVLGQNVENKLQNLQFGTKCRISLNSLNITDLMLE
jgi:hypothetical protein